MPIGRRMRRRYNRRGRVIYRRRVVYAWFRDSGGRLRMTDYQIRGRGIRAAERLARRWLAKHGAR